MIGHPHYKAATLQPLQKELASDILTADFYPKKTISIILVADVYVPPSQNQKLSVEHEQLKAEHNRLKVEEAEKSARLHELM